MAVSLKITVPDIQGLSENIAQLDKTVIEGWGADANTLLEIEKANVARRTYERARDTGALTSSVTGQAYAGAKNQTLVAIWFNSAQQYAEWGRYYAPYQEGPPIGLATYTNAPRHMLFDAHTEDADQVREWAVNTGTAAIEDTLAPFAEGQ